MDSAGNGNSCIMATHLMAVVMGGSIRWIARVMVIVDTEIFNFNSR